MIFRHLLILSFVCLGACHESGVDFRDVTAADVDEDTTPPERRLVIRSATASVNSLAAPDYTLDMDPLRVEADDDGIVQSARGAAEATDGEVTGQAYVLVGELAGTRYADIDDAFSSNPRTAISQPDPQIDAAAFKLMGADLDLQPNRYLIIANTVADVSSYQLITITFLGP